MQFNSCVEFHSPSSPWQGLENLNEKGQQNKTDFIAGGGGGGGEEKKDKKCLSSPYMKT